MPTKINHAESALLVGLDEGLPTYLTCNLYFDSYKIGIVSVLEKENQVRQEQCEVLDYVVSLINLAVLREKRFNVQYSKAQQMMSDLIEDMVKLDLERAEVRNHVIFSCQIVHYLSIMEN